MDLSFLPDLKEILFSSEIGMPTIFAFGTIAVVFLLLLLKLSFVNMKKIDAKKLKEFQDSNLNK